MTLVEHIYELRTRLLISVAAIVVTLGFGFWWYGTGFLGVPSLGGILTGPYCDIPPGARLQLGDAGDECRLLGLIVVGHFLGVAARGLGLLELLVLDGEEFRAERFDLLLGCRPDVCRGDDGAHAARGRDRLQPGDPDAHDECARGGNRA